MAIKVLTIFKAEDIIDLQKSKLEWSLLTKRNIKEGMPKTFDLSLYWRQQEAHFIESKLQDVFLFRIIESMSYVYVTQPVVDIVNEAGLTGAEFTQIYPSSCPNEIRKVAYEKAMKRRKHYCPDFPLSSECPGLPLSGYPVHEVSSAPKTLDSDANSEEKSETNSIDANAPVDKSNQKE